MPTPDIAVGVDVGTQGARVLAVTIDGVVVGESAVGWTLRRGHDGLHQQDPMQWLDAVVNALAGATARLEPARLLGISVTSTSGTLVLADSAGFPVRPAIMWDDTRAEREALELLPRTETLERNTGLRLRPSFPLAKLAWLLTHEPAAMRSAAHVLHESDWLLWQLGGLDHAVTDPTNALKTGFDPVQREWLPLLSELGIRELLPDVVAAGVPVGTLSAAMAARTGLPEGLSLIGAMTDANTATLAAGLFAPGGWSTTLGTGLSIKGRVDRPIADAASGVYSHVHPFGGWLASGTVHTGGGIVTQRFGSDQVELTRLNIEAAAVPPGQTLHYPLAGRGEFFPFWAPHAEEFVVGSPTDRAGGFRAMLEGIAVIERMSFDRMRAAGAPQPSEIVALGGSTKSPLWNLIRASLLEAPIRLRKRADTAYGAAITAAVGSGITPVEVGRHMVHAGTVVHPDVRLVPLYRDVLARYEEEFLRRGYLRSGSADVSR